MKITVCIPCRNEIDYIQECVNAIYECDLPKEASLNVNIVDGMSDDGTRDKIAELQKTYPTLNLVDNVKQLTPYAFNLGIRATGKVDFVQIVGARHILSKNYLMRSIQKLRSEPNTWCVGGKIINEYINHRGEIIARAMGTTFGMGLGNFRTLEKSGYTDTVTSPMYSYHVFEEIGFFDEMLVRNQDDDFNYRVTKEGKKIFFDHEISLKYYVRGNFKGLWRQFFQYGYWKVFVNRKHKAVTTFRQLVPALFLLYLIGLPLLNFVGAFWCYLGFIPLFLYLMMMCYFSAKHGRYLGEVLQLILTYWILHISYGLGYLKGVFEFLILRKQPSKRQARLSR